MNVDGFRKFNSGDIAWVITEEEDYVYRFIYQGGVWQLFPFALEEEVIEDACGKTGKRTLREDEEEIKDD